jgi:hypothetical protein
LVCLSLVQVSYVRDASASVSVQSCTAVVHPTHHPHRPLRSPGRGNRRRVPAARTVRTCGDRAAGGRARPVLHPAIIPLRRRETWSMGTGRPDLTAPAPRSTAARRDADALAGALHVRRRTHCPARIDRLGRLPQPTDRPPEQAGRARVLRQGNIILDTV